MDITPFLKLLVQKKGSDLFFTGDAPVKMKIEGVIMSVGKMTLTKQQVESAVYGIMFDRQRTQLKDDLEVDFAIELEEENARFRVNIFRQRGSLAMVLRLIPNQIPSIEDLELPSIIKQLIMNKRGLILMVGSTGSGKSTTLASMLSYRNHAAPGHILTIEDPIEYSHPNAKCIINQREIGMDTHSYSAALRSAMRESPDVIMIGEIRDRETMGAALELCNTGHLCVSTMHANNSNQAIERVINLFPHDHHKQLLMDLSINLRAVLSQRLVTGVDTKRLPAVEVLINNPHITDLILKGDLDQIKEAMHDSGDGGMQTFDRALYELYLSDRIDLEEAMSNADSRTNFEAQINFA
ncbi:MAG: PilT/PilU family type 4a pilus ATPase [Gammaproteobacteria bacterium]